MRLLSSSSARFLTVLGLVLSGMAGCGGDDDGDVHDGAPRPDGRSVDGATDAVADAPADAPGAADAPTTDGPSGTSAQIQAARDAVDGPVTLAIAGALVTYVKPSVGTDVPGFFLQADTLGPALFVAVDPATLSPAPAAGDQVDLVVTEMATSHGLRQASAVSGLVRVSSGNPLAALVQDISSASDVVASAGAYESELVSFAGSLAGVFVYGGADHSRAPLSTAGIASDANYNFRLPDALLETLDLAQGCEITVTGTPLWRYDAQVQPSAWDASEVSITSCPAPEVVSAVSASVTSVLVNFDRRILASSLYADGSQFVFDDGLVASGAAISGDNPRQVTVTTATQTSDNTYTVTVAASLTDLLGAGVSASSNTADFTGFLQGAVLKINEFTATISSSCDLVELRVVQGGSMEGITLWERDGAVAGEPPMPLVTFSAFDVSKNDIIVVHLNGESLLCNGGAPGSETTSPSEYWHWMYLTNYDTAYDWLSVDDLNPGLTATDNVLTLYDKLGGVMDAVLTADDPTGTAAASSETQAAVVAAAGHWTMVGGGVPPSGFVDDDFCAHAVLDLNATDIIPDTDSIQRTSNVDTNTKEQWTTSAGVAATFGAKNVGQTDLPID